LRLNNYLARSGGLFLFLWTIFEGISAICPKMGRLSTQVEEELAQIFGIRG